MSGGTPMDLEISQKENQGKHGGRTGTPPQYGPIYIWSGFSGSSVATAVHFSQKSEGI